MSKPENVKTVSEGGGRGLTPSRVLLAFAGIFLLNLLLRVFYLRYDFVNGDEGVRALTATRLLEGARLYVDVVTDKPPGTTLFYAAVFALFGRSMKAVHLAAAVWNFITSVIIYLIAARFSSKRAGLWAAALFVYFSTNYLTQDMMAANTELLMGVPYAAGLYLYLKADRGAPLARKNPGRSATPALIAAGLVTGFAAMFKQVGVLNLCFFAACEACRAYGAGANRCAEREGHIKASLKRSFIRLSLIAAGFVAGLAAPLAWLAAMGSLAGFWNNTVALSRHYIDSDPAGLWLKFIVSRGLGYVFFNASLWALAAWAAARSVRPVKSVARNAWDETDNYPLRPRYNLVLTLWAAVSLSSALIGGRFFGHYFIPALPALSLLAAEGIELLGRRTRDPARRRGALTAVAILGSFFIVGFVRSHHRTAILAYEAMTGARTRWSARWGMTERQHEAEAIAESLRGKITEGEPLYIWGYAHDVYWRTGCRPASRYLAPYYVDGRFPDAEARTIAPGESPWREARDNLLEDLRRSRPRLILDVYGSIQQVPHPEIVDFIRENYREGENIGPEPSRPFRALWLKGE